MKTFLVVLALLATPFAHAAILGQPFIPEVDQRFDALEGGAYAQSHNILSAQPEAVIVYDFATNGGSTLTSPIKLPANAYITRSYFHVKTALVGSGASIAWSCGVANNILSAVAVTSVPASGFLEGVSTGASTLFKDVGASACNVKMTVTGGTLTAGHMAAYLEYAVHQ